MSHARLDPVLDELLARGPLAVAVSGGVDSLTLMAYAHRRLHGGAVITAFHATSPAVPASSTERVRELADKLAWTLRIIDAGETRDAEYLANPADRCRVCKTHLYDAVAALVDAQTTIVSGTNLDDVDDYRPGLAVAAARGVRHPFVEAKLTKLDVRALARSLGLDDVAELPAQPCLSSRIETGLAIDAATLSMVNDVEDAVRARVGARATVRCRVRKAGLVVEIDPSLLNDLSDAGRAGVLDVARTVAGVDVALAPYKMGSAFLRVVV